LVPVLVPLSPVRDAPLRTVPTADVRGLYAMPAKVESRQVRLTGDAGAGRADEAGPAVSR